MNFANRVQKIKPSPTLALNTRAKKMQADGINVINFTCGEPDFDTPQHIKDAAAVALKNGFTKYTPVSGIPELKDAISAMLKREHGFNYTRDEIIVTPGAKYAIFAAMQALLNPNDEVLIPAPYWVSYPEQVLLCEACPVIINSTEKSGFKISAAQIEATITDKTKLLILNTPSNPTGTAYSEAELKEIARVCLKHNLWIISDEIYDGIVFDGFVAKSIAAFDGMKERTVIINGVSKKYAMTGWRMGFAAGPKALITQLEVIQSQAVTNITSFVQKAAIAAYNGPSDDVTKMVAAFCERRNYITQRLNNIELRCMKPQGTFYAFPNVTALFGRTLGGRKINTSSDVSEYLLDIAHVATVPGDAFGADGFIRLSYATSMENIKEGLDRIEKTIRRDS